MERSVQYRHAHCIAPGYVNAPVPCHNTVQRDFDLFNIPHYILLVNYIDKMS